MENTTNEILTLIKKKMQEQGAFSRDAYKQFTEETIDYFIEKGKLIDDDNLELIKDNLLSAYTTIADELSESN